MNKYDISEKRLRIFDIENWFSKYFTSKKLIDVEFYQKRNLIKCSNCHVNFHKIVLMNYKSYYNFDCSLVEKIKFEIELTKLQSHIRAKTKILTIELLKQKKTQLIEQKIQKQTQRKIKLIECQIKWKAKKHVEIIEQIYQKIQLFKSTFRDIDVFDSIFICDILKFDLYNKMMNFLQHFQQIQHQYLKQNVFDLLFKCFQNFAFAWFKNQIFNIIQNFDRNLTCAFSIIFFEFITKLFIFTSNFSSQYHLCVECFVQFSSMIRFLKHTKQINCSKMICKHCEQNFNFKNKFHEHIREQHIQKSNINSNFRFFTSKFINKIKKKSISFISFVSSIFFATFTFMLRTELC